MPVGDMQCAMIPQRGFRPQLWFKDRWFRLSSSLPAAVITSVPCQSHSVVVLPGEAVIFLASLRDRNPSFSRTSFVLITMISTLYTRGLDWPSMRSTYRLDRRFICTRLTMHGTFQNWRPGAVQSNTLH